MASGVIWNAGGLDALAVKINARGTGGRAVVQTILNDVADEAVERMRKTILSTPSALSPGKGDRYWTGQMHDAIKRTPVEVNGSKISVKFGWPYGVEDYYIYQDWGVDPTGKRKPIPPMHALLGAFIWATLETNRRLKDMRL